MTDEPCEPIPPDLLLRLAACTGDGIAQLDPDRRIVAANPAFRRLLGLQPLETICLDSLVAPESAEAFADMIETSMPHGAVFGDVSLLNRASGAAVPFEISIFRQSEPEGHGFIGHFRDITRRYERAHERREREAELARAKRLGRIGGFEVELDGAQMRNRRSPEYLDLHGLDERHAGETHKDWVSRLHPDDRAQAETGIRDVVAGVGRDYTAEYRILTPNGDLRWIRAVGEIERDAEGRALRMVGAHIDITAAKAAEAAVRLSETRFRAAVAAMRGIVWTNDAEGRMAGEQPGWSALTGQTRAEYEGFGWSAAVHPEDAPGSVVAWHEAVRLRRRFDFVHRVRRADGTWRLFAVTAEPMIDAEGRIREWVGVHTDITQERAAEDALRMLNDDLEVRVRQEVAAREQTQAELAKAQRLEALGQLAGGIAHDFNNVLQAVQGAASLIERRADDPDSVRRLTRMTLEAARRGASVTRRMLTFSRRGELRAELFDPSLLLADLAELLAHTIGGSVSVSVEVASDLPQIHADKGQLETVLINLATNARDAMPEGGLLVFSARHDDASERPASIVLEPGPYLRLSAQDTGCGMSAETLARASEPFFTTKAAGAGTGLGLAMARGFATQSGGALHIDSSPGSGTTISIWLPVASPHATDPSVGLGEPTAGPGVPAPIRGRLLLTDDDTLVRETLAEDLALHGFRVIQAADAASALAVLAGPDPIDLLISDLSMIGLDGLSLIRQAQRIFPSLPAILLTGFATDAAAALMNERVLGRFMLLRKPLPTAELVEAIAAMLDVSPPAVSQAVLQSGLGAYSAAGGPPA